MAEHIENGTPESGTIRVRRVTKTYRLGKREVHALRGVDLEISSPGFYAIMGPSGSGKSTLLHLLAALDRPDSGTIEVAGCRIDTMTEAELTRYRRRRIGIIFQQYNLISTLSAIDNVTLPGLLDGMRRKDRNERGRRLLDELGMQDRASHRPDALSGGEQQRVAIARALLFQPRVLFADEPTGNLDSETSRQLWSLLKTLARDHRMTILMVTHEQSATAHCQNIFHLRDGQVESTAAPEKIDVSELATRG